MPELTTPADAPSVHAIAGRPAAAGRRLAWVDVAKGIGIVLVVLGHALDGVMSARLADPLGPTGFAHHLLYTFHMPVFFFLTGWFVMARLEHDRARFGRDALVRILWPYLLWSLVYLAVSAAMAGEVNKARRFDAPSVLSLLWQPEAHLWFLYAVLVLHGIAWLVPARVRLPALAVLAAAGYALNGFVDAPRIVERLATFAPFYVAGMVAGDWARRGAGLPMALPWAGIVAAALAWFVAATAAWRAGQGYWSPAALPAALLGGVTTLALSARLRGAVAQRLVVLGRASMAIFVLHVLCTAGTRIAFVKIGVTAPALIVIAGTVVGIAVPLVVDRLARRLNLQKVVGLG